MLNCQICNTALTATGCPRCNQRREIGLIQARCISCDDLFTYDAEYPRQAKCDPCTTREIQQTSLTIRQLGLRVEVV